MTQLGYKTIGFELPKQLIFPIDEYVHNGTVNLKEKMQSLVLYKTQEIHQLFEWIKEYNSSQSDDNKVSIFGYDDE